MVKGFFIEVTVDSRMVFSAATPELDKESFLKVWSVAGERFYAKAIEAVKEERSLQYGQIRFSPLTD